ncbi:ATP-binding cassette domain-containing protein [Marinilactibacillus kalidii]|uniref:ATP-binding cassette domain-containing protein n=1 Tax=Marinilactibacillus kalidii TaxID=2820274 RepID=UPI001ABE82EB|nr:ATP-binding cassette domain-containing protein [Marinilactibacillus kalidii]
MSIQLKNVHFEYEDNLLFHNIDFTFKENTIYTLLGPSGTGKSTLLDLLKKSSEPTNGVIQYQHLSVTDIVTVFQKNQLFPWSTVSDTLELPLKITKYPVSKRTNKIMALAEELSLEDLLSRKIPMLSGGQVQRVAIGQGLAMQPKVLLLDEPTSSLDQEAKEEIQEILLKEQKKRGHMMIVVTHDIEEAVYLGQEILLLKDQQLQLFHNPTTHLHDRRNDVAFYQFCIEMRKQVRT